jgi:glucarate dehydratase
MKITDVKATPVTVPMEAPLRWSMGIETGTTRTIVELSTDAGVVGIGETYGGNATAQAILNSCAPLVKGEDPSEIGKIIAKFSPYFEIPYETSVPPHAFAGVEMACWDAVGKSQDKPVSSLLGGALKQEIPFISYLFYRYEGKGGIPAIDSAETMLKYHERLEKKYGKFSGAKIKGGVFRPEEEMKAVKLFRETQGDDFALRFDPNGFWSVETSIRILKQMEQYNLEFVEDPTLYIEGMARVRKEVSIPFSTNMCVIWFNQIMPAVRLGAIDMIQEDLHYWGGLQLNRKLVSIAEALQLGLAIHSDRELGISTAAVLHFVSSQPWLTHAVDSHYHHQEDDIITEPFTYRDGKIKVPDGPGLGVEIDRKKLDKYAKMYKEQGDVNEFYDSRRPNWIPVMPQF